jgi:hypothetical protein
MDLSANISHVSIHSLEGRVKEKLPPPPAKWLLEILTVISVAGCGGSGGGACHEVQ